MTELNPQENPFGHIMLEMAKVGAVGIDQGMNLMGRELLSVMQKHVEQIPMPVWMDLMALVKRDKQ